MTSSTIDLLYTIYYECHGAGEGNIEQDQYGFQNCLDVPTHPRFGFIRGPQGESPVSMFWAQVNSSGQQPQQQLPQAADSHPILGRFFRSIPSRYSDLIDVRALGYSYSAQRLMSQLQTLQHVCQPSLQRTATATPTRTPRSSSTNDRWFRLDDWRRLTMTRWIKTPNATETMESAASSTWLDAALTKLKAYGRTDREAIEQLEMMECLSQFEKTHQLQDFSTMFREQFHILPTIHSRCVHLLGALLDGKKKIMVDNWRSTFYR